MNFIEEMKKHYKKVLEITEEQKQCLNPFIPDNELPVEISNYSLSFLCPITKIEKLTNKRLLDIGCGIGTDCFLAAKKVKPEGQVIGIDPIPKYINQAKRLKKKYQFDNIQFLTGTLQELNFIKNTFDYITMNYSFHLIRNKINLLKEIHRLLKDDGQAIIGDSFSPVDFMFKEDPEKWFYQAGGAITVEKFKEYAVKAKFSECQFEEVGDKNLSDDIVGYMILDK